MLRSERFLAFEDLLQILSSSEMSMEERIHTIVERAYDDYMGGTYKQKICHRRIKI